MSGFNGVDFICLWTVKWDEISHLHDAIEKHVSISKNPQFDSIHGQTLQEFSISNNTLEKSPIGSWNYRANRI